MDAKTIDLILTMAHSPVSNYVIPGLTSSLVGGTTNSGNVRLFENSRAHQEDVVPHSHRFNFQCIVLVGQITNKTWFEVPDTHLNSDWFELSESRYQGEIGRYKTSPVKRARFANLSKTYVAGETYGMRAEEIHSIKFSRGAKVLFFEGPSHTNSRFIEPLVNGEVIRTMQVESWMFKRT